MRREESYEEEAQKERYAEEDTSKEESYQKEAQQEAVDAEETCQGKPNPHHLTF